MAKNKNINLKKEKIATPTVAISLAAAMPTARLYENMTYSENLKTVTRVDRSCADG
jgi:hypothetical protein